MDVIERRALADDQALHRRAAELNAHRRELAERSKRLGPEIAHLKLRGSAELTIAHRQLRDDARARLAHPDAGYPQALADAAAELGRRSLCRIEELISVVAARTLAGLEIAPRRYTGPTWSPPPIALPPRRARGYGEELMLALAGLSGGLGLIRLAWGGGPPAPATAGLLVSAATALAWWLARTRRAGAERSRLMQWTHEALADTRCSLDTAFTQRLLDLESRLREALVATAVQLERQAAELTARRDSHREAGR